MDPKLELMVPLVPFFKKGMKDTTEAEVSFMPTPKRFESITDTLKGRNYPVTSQLSLDISFSKSMAKSNIAYRVSILGKDHIDKALVEGHTFKDALLFFQHLVNVAKERGYILQEKVRDKSKSAEIGSSGLTLRLSDETPLSLDKVDKLPKNGAKNIFFRLKDRTTQVIIDAGKSSSGFTLKIDSTIVHSGKTVSEIEQHMKAGKLDHEIEVELMSKRNVKTVPTDVLEAFASEIKYIHDLSKQSHSHASLANTTHTSTKSSSEQGVATIDEHGHAIPRKWMLSNRQGYLDWVYKTFDTEAYARQKGVVVDVDGAKGANGEKGALQLFPHQKVVRDFMQFKSPYRGLLLYHGLGTGKTISSIAAAQGFIQNNKKVIVLLPASLETNYRDEIIHNTTDGNPSTKVWTQIVLEKPEEVATLQSALHINAAGMGGGGGMGGGSEGDKKEGKDTKKEKVKTKAEGFTLPVHVWVPTALLESTKYTFKNVATKQNLSWGALNVAEKQAATRTLEHLLDVKYTFIRYNGISNAQLTKLGANVFNNAFIVIDEAHNFISRVVHGGASSTARRMYHAMMEAVGCKVVLLTGTPIINHPYELGMLLNLARGPMPVTNITIVAKGKNDVPPSDAFINSIIEAHDVAPYIDQWTYATTDSTLQVSLLPHGYKNSTNWNGDVVIAHGVWKKTKTEILQHIMDALDKANYKAKCKDVDMYAYPSKKDEFVQHFIDESDYENPKVKNMDLFARRMIGLVSYYKSAGEEYFPTVLPRKVERIPMCDTQFNTYVLARDKERRMESKKKRSAGLFAAQATVYRAFSRMACNFVFPKEIPRVFPNDLRNALKREIETLDEDEDKIAAKEAGVDEAVGEPKKVKASDVLHKYEESMNDIMTKLAKNADKYLSLDSLQNYYSSKLAKVYSHIDTSPGKVLYYSQFRTIEGLGVTRLMLEHHGYIEVEVKVVKGKEWQIVNAKEVLDAKYNGKRYIVFDGNRDKTQLLLQIYNGEFTKLPQSIKDQLQGGFQNAANVYGDIIKLIMITQSGAEGISLKCVRRVLIMEPFWNMVRMDQVVGRAVRTGSHLDLPLAERTVEVFIYTSEFTAKQLKENFTLRRLDNSMSSDTHIMLTAHRKDALIQVFMNAVKSAAVDCRNNAAYNVPTKDGLTCYAFPFPAEPNTYAFTPSIDYDSAHIKSSTGKMVRKRQIQGYVVSIAVPGSSARKKYVKVDAYPDKIYDYNAYKNAGVLVEVSV